MNTFQSAYTQRPADRYAEYIQPGVNGVYGDGVHDDTAALQAAITAVKGRQNHGIVFLAEGTYLISDTIYIPKAIRLIGYGKNRPVIVLKDRAAGYDRAYPEDKGGCKYMLWFVDRVPKAGGEVHDANPGTFYSAMSNVDVKIGAGNPYAVALRTHYAQHCFINHCRIDIGDGFAGMYDAGNEMENVHFFGGEYGLKTTKCSPGWPFMVVDCTFTGQRKAAIHSRELGLTALRLHIKDVPKAIDTEEGFMDKILIEDSVFENIPGPAMTMHCEKNTFNQWNLLNVVCHNVPHLMHYADLHQDYMGKEGLYRIDRFTHGVQLKDMTDPGDELYTDCEMTVLEAMPEMPASDVPVLPDMAKWVNVCDLGAKGDNETDDTAVLQAAIDQYDVLYFPQGRYVVTDTLKMRENTALIGLNPISTNIVLPENTENFGEMGPAKALIETAEGGNAIMNGLGINTGGRNPRAVGVKWMAGEKSFMNDVKFLGGHGDMDWGDNVRPWVPTYNASRTADADPNKKWDIQYWSLWVTNNGGGVFKDVWTASPYACAGFYASDTKTPGRIYCMSIEHHVRSEVKFKNVENWRVYAMQTEEEVAESQMCQPLEMQNCRNMLFGTYYSFRVIWLPNPYPSAVRLWDCEDITWLNVHNYTQVKYTLTNTMEDMTTGRQVRPWQFARFVQGKQPEHAWPEMEKHVPVKLYDGFEFTDAVCTDKDGNFYFADARYHRIYKIDAQNGNLSLVRDVPQKPLSMFFDTENNMLVLSEFIYPRGATRGGQPIVNVKPADAKGTSYGGWYLADAVVKVYTMDPNDPENTMKMLSKVPAKDMPKVAQSLHPANRWRDNNDTLWAVVQETEMTTVAPDGVTVIPDYYDLIRSNTVLPAVPGKTFCSVDEYYKRVLAYDVKENGFLENVRVLVEHGEYSIVNDLENDRLYVADGDVLVYNAKGEMLQRIPMPIRPATMALGGKDGKTLLVTARNAVYAIRV